MIPPLERRTVAVASLLAVTPGDFRAFVILRTDQATLVARAEVQARQERTATPQGSLPAWQHTYQAFWNHIELSGSVFGV